MRSHERRKTVNIISVPPGTAWHRTPWRSAWCRLKSVAWKRLPMLFAIRLEGDPLVAALREEISRR